MSFNRKAEVRSTRSGRLRLTMRGPPWVQTGKARCEQMFSAVPPEADIAKILRHVRFVPLAEVVPLIQSTRRLGRVASAAR